MASPTGIIPDAMFTRERSGDVLRFLAALPIPADDKEELLAGWALWVGAQFNASQIEKLRASGTDRAATGGR
jgi:hypothetical protein